MVTQDERADFLTVAEAERRFNEIDRRLGYIEDRVADLTQGQRAINDRLDKVGERIERLEGKFDNRFARLEDKIDERFARLEDKIDERFAAVDERFGKVDEKADRNFNILNAKIDEAVAGIYARIAAVEDALRRENRWMFGILLALILAILGMLIRQMV